MSIDNGRLKNPAFGIAQIRELTEIFIDKSIELRDVWALESMKPETSGRIDVLSWLSRTTLDVIGLAGGYRLTPFAKGPLLKHFQGFNYNFGALSSDPNTNELNNAFQVIFHTGMSMNFINMLRMVFPIFRFLVCSLSSFCIGDTFTYINSSRLNVILKRERHAKLCYGSVVSCSRTVMLPFALRMRWWRSLLGRERIFFPFL
jgi:hypothetical protein